MSKRTSAVLRDFAPQVAPLFLTWAAFYLFGWFQTDLKMDAMTFATIGRNILRTGDWLVLHYQKAAYAEFYQHPPLYFWSLAMFMRFFGEGDFAVRLLASLHALVTLGLAVWSGVLVGRRNLGIVAAWILLLTPRFIKYSSDGLLDGPMTMWLMGAYCFWLRSFKKPNSFWGFGFCLSAAFLTKGIASLALPAGIFAWLAMTKNLKRKPLKILGLALVTALGVLTFWSLFLNGSSFLKHYFSEHVFAAKPGTLYGGAGILLILGTTYWPWLPFSLLALIKRNPAAIVAWLVPLAFWIAGQGYDHYLVPFYGFSAFASASVLAGLPLARWKYWKHTAWVGAVTMFLLVSSDVLRLHTDRRDPFSLIVGELRARCTYRELWVDTSVADIWRALALGSWKGGVETRSVSGQKEIPDGVVLITNIESSHPLLKLNGLIAEGGVDVTCSKF